MFCLKKEKKSWETTVLNHKLWFLIHLQMVLFRINSDLTLLIMNIIYRMFIIIYVILSLFTHIAMHAGCQYYNLFLLFLLLFLYFCDCVCGCITARSQQMKVQLDTRIHNFICSSF